ncbi:MAG: hypothetical protein JO124_21115 [Hyphomicrobiales bacterium]|uniref:hypothetical protein n=1 Tax=Bradyrhizobium sp. TaxID=376 RepID=UPI001DEE7C58|nr:hypothetical protein [Bradyrhizobium sp.]MBV8450484.1 hypothetical protein [Hyphomicrobiales bacterium]MBV8922936.1 hypothetical protein [Bradyrhizobium sp.]MBV9977863.1 hypothetical protein [Hyphomicrobiales bacterium]
MNGGRLEVLQTHRSDASAELGRWVFRLVSAVLVFVGGLQILNAAGMADFGLTDWRPFCASSYGASRLAPTRR